MTYLVCTKNKSKPRKSIAVCEKCKHNKKCREYQKYLTQKEKEETAMAEANQNIKIPMFPVVSKNILSIGYNANTRTMRIEFKKNVLYDYSAIPPELFQGMMAAESKGGFFNDNFRNKFEFHKIEREEEK